MRRGSSAFSCFLAGSIPRAINRGDYEEAKRLALEYQEIFGEGNFFLKLQDHETREQIVVND